MSTEITINQSTIDINVTEQVITIEAPSGAYPLPSTVTSVFGRTGAILALNGDYNTSLVTENTNLYFTNTRARTAISLTTTGTSGAATYDNATGIFNIPQYQGGVTSFNTRTGAISLLSADVTGALGFTPYNATNPAAYISGITSGMVTTALGYTPVTNARTLTINGTTYDLTADRSWTIAAGVTSVFGRTGVVVATEGDYTLTQLGDVTITTPANGQVLKYNGTAWVNGTDTDTGLTSVGLSMPSAFTVSNSPLTANGTLSVTGAGIASQYVRGDGTLANFPTSGGGGSSVAYYFNSSVSQGTLGGVAYRELSKVPIIGAGTDITIATNGYIASYITDAGDPALLEIPAGNWNFEMYFNASSGGGTPSFYVQLYKYDGTTFTLISSSSATPEGITNGTAIDLYTTALAVPLTTLTLTDRLAIRVYVNNSGRTITLHTENSHLCEVITTFTTGLTALNGLTAQVQFLATGTSGTDFNISSATATHTFNLPVASATNTGKLSSTDWSVFSAKQTALSGTGFVKISGTTISYDNSTYYLASNPSAFIALTALSAGTGISYNNTTGVITNTITQYTDALARASISLTTTGSSGAATYDNTTGVLNIPQYSGGGGGSISLAAIGSTPNANAATLTGTVLNLEPASASFGGVVTTGTQSFAGQKNFSGSVVINGTTPLFSSALTVIQSGSNRSFTVQSSAAKTNTTAFNLYSLASNESANMQSLDVSIVGAATLSNRYFSFQTGESGVANGGNIVFQGAAGNLGVGTSTIGSKLQVNGNAAIGYSASTAAPTNGLAVSGAVTISNSSTAVYALDIQVTNGPQTLIGLRRFGLADWGITLGNESVPMLYIGAANSNPTTRYFWRANYNVGGVASNTFRVCDTSLTGIPVLDIQGVASTTASYLNVTSSGGAMGNLFVVNSGGNVGINTTTIGSKFQVNGSAAIGYSSSTAAPTNGLAVSGASTFGSSVTITATSTNIPLTLNAASAANNTMILNHGGLYNAIQINTSSSTEAGVIGWGNSTAQAALANSFYFLINRANVASASIRFTGYNGSAVENYMTIVGSTGNVGIATTTIGSQLQVNGNVAIGYSASTAAPTNGLAVAGDTTIAGVLRATITTNRQTASYTLVLADRGKLVEMNVATANNLTIPLNATVAFPIGTQIDLSQYGAGQTTVVATGGVTIRSTNSWVKLNAQYAAATLIKIGTDEWYLFGNLNA